MKRTMRSNPKLNPECLTVPCLRRSKYHSYCSLGNPSSLILKTGREKKKKKLGDLIKIYFGFSHFLNHFNNFSSFSRLKTSFSRKSTKFNSCYLRTYYVQADLRLNYLVFNISMRSSFWLPVITVPPCKQMHSIFITSILGYNL